MVRRGADLTGTTCYYESPNIYVRYGVKGYFNSRTKEAVWWDDQLIEEKGHGSPGGNTRLLAQAYFNCPGYGRIILGEKASKMDKQLQRARELTLDNTDWSDFTDEWDFLLESFTVEAHDPQITDSVNVVATKKTIEYQPAKPFSGADSIIAIPRPTPTQIEFTKSPITV